MQIEAESATGWLDGRAFTFRRSRHRPADDRARPVPARLASPRVCPDCGELKYLVATVRCGCPPAR